MRMLNGRCGRLASTNSLCWLVALSTAALLGACDPGTEQTNSGPEQTTFDFDSSDLDVTPMSTSGFRWRSWHVTPWATLGAFTLTGTITAVDPSTASFAVDGQYNVVYAKSLIEALPLGAIEIGQTATVTGELAKDGVLFAESVLLHATGRVVVFGLAGFLDRDYGFDISGYRVISPPEVSQTIEEFSFLKVAGRQSESGFLYPDEILVLGNGPEYFLAGAIDAIDLGANTITVLGIELSVTEWTQQRQRALGQSLNDLAIGDHVSFLLHENRFVRSFEASGDWLNGNALIVNAYFKSLAPPVQFTLYGFADVLVQVDPSTEFSRDEACSTGIGPGAWGGACAPVEITAGEFWAVAERPKPPGITFAIARGRFEGGILIADYVEFDGG